MAYLKRRGEERRGRGRGGACKYHAVFPIG
jgi:hypothetical protein